MSNIEYFKNFIKEFPEEKSNFILDSNNNISGLRMLEFFFICYFSEYDAYSRYDARGAILSL